MNSRFLWSERLCVSILAALLTFGLYAFSASSTVTYGGDCGELIAASYRLGIAHPTGYPLYCLLGRTWSSILPLGEIGWRYNLLSAFCSAVAVGLITATVHRLVAEPQNHPGTQTITQDVFPSKSSCGWPALGAGLLLAGFLDFWLQSAIAEVYPLSAMMLCSLLYVAVAWHQSCVENQSGSMQIPQPDWRWFYTLALLFGLTLNAHLACVFFVPGLLLYVLIQHRKSFRGQWVARLGTALAFVVASWMLTLYLPLRASLFPQPPQLPAFFAALVKSKSPSPSTQAQVYDWHPLDWTHPVNARDWYGHISGRQYKGLLFRPFKANIAGKEIQLPGFASTASQVAERLKTLLERVSLSYLWACPLLLVGFIVSWKRRESKDEYSHSGGIWLGILLLFSVLANVGVQINYQVGDLTNFFFPFYIILAVWMGLGLHWLWQKAKKPFTQLLFVTFLLCTVTSQWWLIWPFASKRGDTTARYHGLDRAGALETLATQTGKTPQALLNGDDALWSFWYVKYALGRAQQTRTPWRVRDVSDKDGGFAPYVAHLQQSGPVAISAWDENTDKQFPYVLLNSSGTLCLASQRALPLPAKPLNEEIASGKIQARFRGQGKENGMDIIKRENMAAFEVDFRLPWTQALSTRETGAPATDPENGAHCVGYVEVFVSQANPDAPGYFARPPAPREADAQRNPDKGPSLLAWRQRRRLVVEQTAREGAPLQLTVPLYFPPETLYGRMQTWVRLVRTPHDKTTPWQKSVVFRLMS